jgi:ribosomal protein S18 acetylase RimI-like enzyme
LNILPENLQDLHLRTVHADDHGFIEALYHSSRNDLCQIDTAPDVIDSLIKMQLQMQSVGYHNTYPHADYIVLEHEGERIGRLVVDVGATDIRVIDLCFLPHAQKKGFGTTVLRHLQQQAAENNLTVTLAVGNNNPEARRLYISLGFQVVSNDGIFEQMLSSSTPDLCTNGHA